MGMRLPSWSSRFKQIQRLSEEAKETWRQFCIRQGTRTHDPGRHDCEFLKRFLSDHAAMEQQRECYAQQVKCAIRTSAAHKDAWHRKCGKHGGNVRDPLRHDTPFLTSFLEAIPPDDATPPLDDLTADGARRNSPRQPSCDLRDGRIHDPHPNHDELPHQRISKRNASVSGATSPGDEPPLGYPRKVRLDWAHNQLLQEGWASLGSLGGRLKLDRQDFTDDKRFLVSMPDEHGQRTVTLPDETGRPRRAKGTGRAKFERSASPGRRLRWQPKL